MSLAEAVEPATSHHHRNIALPPLGTPLPHLGGTFWALMRAKPGSGLPDYALIVPHGPEFERACAWGSYGENEPGAACMWDGLANTLSLVRSANPHPAAAFCDKPYVHIPLTPVVSNQVAAIGYCPDRKVLACTFTRGPGHVYHYPGVEPEFHAAFMAAESKGKFFGANVKPLPFDKFSSETMAEAIKAASDMSETAQA